MDDEDDLEGRDLSMNATKGRPCELVLPELRSTTPDGRLLATGTASVRLDIRDLRWDPGAEKAHMETRVTVRSVRYDPVEGITDGEREAVALVELGLAELLRENGLSEETP